ncbi:TIGR03617 family F420-dependent LLM class oxidoreductase [Streptomyces sp. NPDC005708]|uniref:TIGR03617 family F420-dependent LLM class oxidoreductase n=1 Tax=Streptomyces sp. NPDC005708 TaxID=3154564 RepID=UPI0033FDE9E1
MKIDRQIRATPTGTGHEAAELEALGYDGLWRSEINSDPFVSLVPAALSTNRADIATGIAVAFARSPMNVAHMAHDLQAISEGRFILGLGTQVKAHITRRFSMEWSRPAARMREYVLALRAIWHAWNTGDRLEFEGDFYRHTLMSAEFTPAPNDYGAPRVFLSAVGVRMTETAGEVADGLILHPFTTKKYLEEITLPALDRGLRAAGKERADFELAFAPFVVSGSSEEEFFASKRAIRARIAWYGSTPSYRQVLEIHGWGDLGEALHTMSVSGDPEQIDRMFELIDDDVLEAFAVVAPPKTVAKALTARAGSAVDRLLISGGGCGPGDFR